MSAKAGRIDQLSVLFTAMMAIILTGQMPPESQEAPSDAAQPITKRLRKAERTYQKNRPPAAHLVKTYGSDVRPPNYSAIARQVDVTPQHVRRVFLGLSTSERVMAAIEAELKGDAR